MRDVEKKSRKTFYYSARPTIDHTVWASLNLLARLISNNFHPFYCIHIIHYFSNLWLITYQNLNFLISKPTSLHLSGSVPLTCTLHAGVQSGPLLHNLPSIHRMNSPEIVCCLRCWHFLRGISAWNQPLAGLVVKKYLLRQKQKKLN